MSGNIWMNRNYERKEAESIYLGNPITVKINISDIIMPEINLPSVILLEPIQVPGFIIVSATGAK